MNEKVKVTCKVIGPGDIKHSRIVRLGDIPFYRLSKYSYRKEFDERKKEFTNCASPLTKEQEKRLDNLFDQFYWKSWEFNQVRGWVRVQIRKIIITNKVEIIVEGFLFYETLVVKTTINGKFSFRKRGWSNPPPDEIYKPLFELTNPSPKTICKEIKRRISASHQKRLSRFYFDYKTFDDVIGIISWGKLMRALSIRKDS